MKYINFKRYKFATILKNINLRRYNFLKVPRYLNYRRYNFASLYNSLKFHRYLNYKRYNFASLYNSLKFHRYLNYRRYNFRSFYKYFDIRQYKILKIYRYINYKKIKIIPIYIISLAIVSATIYLCIPIFFNYDKSYVSKTLCNDLKIECEIKGKINYSFVPYPKLKAKDMVIYDLVEKNKILAKFETIEVKLPLKGLLNKKKLDFTKIQLQKAQINLNYEKLSEYKKYFTKDIISKDISLKKGNIDFFDGKKHITTLKKINFKYNNNRKSDQFVLEGEFLGDSLYINLKNEKEKKNPTQNLTLKLNDLNLLVKMSFAVSNAKKNTVTGNALIKKDKNRITTTFDFKDDQITILNANLKNIFLDGEAEGNIKFDPYFDFILNMNLNTLNFNTLHNSIIKLNERDQKNLFRINNKINGRINLSAKKVFSRHTFIDSFESQIQFINGDILIDQLLLSMGKLGAADLTGTIQNNKKFTNLKFEKNIFIDNLKRFYNKFGVMNKQKTPYNLFVSGNLDLVKLNLKLHEISSDEKINNEDVVFIEREFNNIILGEGYESFFNFSNIKEFVKLITSEDN